MTIVVCMGAGCMFEAQRAFGCNNVGVFGCKDRPQPPTAEEPAPRKAVGRWQARPHLTPDVVRVGKHANSKHLTVGAVRLEVPDDWAYAVEGAHRDSGGGDVVVIHPASGVGTVHLRSYVATEAVSQRTLRNMTNIDPMVPLVSQDWGETTGYQYDYLERGELFRQWWLTHGETLVFVTYRCRAEQHDAERASMDELVNSLTIVTPGGPRI